MTQAGILIKKGMPAFYIELANSLLHHPLLSCLCEQLNAGQTETAS